VRQPRPDVRHHATVTAKPSETVHRPPYVELPERAVMVTSPRGGPFPGTAQGYAGQRVYCSWTEGVGETYLGWVDADKVERPPDA
jgi:hypothetical protein